MKLDSIITPLPYRFLALFVLLAASMLLNLCLGDTNLTPQQAYMALRGDPQMPEGVTEVIWQIRLPRLLTAAVVGLSLSISGYLLQSLSRNFLADPYLTGVSSGAALTVAVVMVLGLNFALVPAAALAGGLVASVCAAAMARTAGGISVTRLLLAGVAISAICGAAITLLLTSSEAARAQGIFYWLAGSLGGRGWIELQSASLYVSIACAIAVLMTKPLRLLSLGAQSAAALGLDVDRTQWIVLAVAVVLCGAAVSLSGVVGFVGLIAPYFARMLFGRDERAHLAACAFTGAILVLISDLCARTLGAGQELPLGTLLSLVGAPFFLWLIVHRRGEGL